ncbi:hypothetical protein ACAW74_16760 [Fibrella sp. WM1]|uniref:hypothetical protein n=1 Tax=Fibrella musci TaxID=3242485 RepID=UPI0035203834
MSNKTLLTFLLFLLSIALVSGQHLAESNLLWSETRKLSVNDFIIKTKQLQSNPSFSQFSIEYQVNGFDFLTKNFNKKVRNYFITSASWIDTTADVKSSLLYQQTLFDLSEVYTRRFRKALKENRKKLATGLRIAEELNNQIVSDFSRKRIDYDTETKFGTDQLKQKEWELYIQNELKQLDDFAYGT